MSTIRSAAELKGAVTELVHMWIDRNTSIRVGPSGLESVGISVAALDSDRAEVTILSRGLLTDGERYMSFCISPSALMASQDLFAVLYEEVGLAMSTLTSSVGNEDARFLSRISNEITWDMSPDAINIARVIRKIVGGVRLMGVCDNRIVTSSVKLSELLSVCADQAEEAGMLGIAASVRSFSVHALCGTDVPCGKV